MRWGEGFPCAARGGLTVNPRARIPLATEIGAHSGFAWMVSMPKDSVDELSPTGC